jgi:hypothetical protein
LRIKLGNQEEEWGTEGADFPDRETREATYTLSGDWGKLFDDVLAYARELVERSVGESKLRQRMSWWAALALLRCVSSSPAAASASLRTKLFNLQSGTDCASPDAAAAPCQPTSKTAPLPTPKSEPPPTPKSEPPPTRSGASFPDWFRLGCAGGASACSCFSWLVALVVVFH